MQAAAVFVMDNNVSLSANEKEQVLSEPLIMKESEILKVQATSGACRCYRISIRNKQGG